VASEPLVIYHTVMTAKQAYRRTSHSVYLCDYHIILATKYRRDCITDDLWGYLYGKLLEITKHYPRIYFHQANHDKDHIHLLVSIPPQMTVGDVVRVIKSNTSRKIREKFPHLKRVYWGTDGIWSDGYFVSTVGVNQSVIQRYIQNQGAEDTGQTATLFG
jgi:putative transposase